MKRIIVFLLVLLAVGSLKAIIVKYQISEAGVVASNIESSLGPTPTPPGGNKG